MTEIYDVPASACTTKKIAMLFVYLMYLPLVQATETQNSTIVDIKKYHSFTNPGTRVFIKYLVKRWIKIDEDDGFLLDFILSRDNPRASMSKSIYECLTQKPSFDVLAKRFGELFSEDQRLIKRHNVNIASLLPLQLLKTDKAVYLVLKLLHFVHLKNLQRNARSWSVVSREILCPFVDILLCIINQGLGSDDPEFMKYDKHNPYNYVDDVYNFPILVRLNGKIYLIQKPKPAKLGYKVYDGSVSLGDFVERRSRCCI